jgi:predicted ATPase
VHIASVHLQSFRRFTDLKLDLADVKPKLVILCGPNGSGKSSFFDALRIKVTMQHGGWNNDRDYYLKAGVPNPFGIDLSANQANVVFHDLDPNLAVPKSAVYVRTAYRNDPEFAISTLNRANSPLDGPQAQRMIDNDAQVSDNYQRLVGQTIDSLYGGTDDGLTGREIRDRLIGRLREVLHLVYPDLDLLGPGNPLEGGTFRFKKGASNDYVYKNLSGGEKAVFDLLLDLLAKQPSYNDTVFCIDEPEAHTNPKVQGALLDAMLSVLPSNSQLWLSTHAVGIMKRARDLQAADPQSVAFIDFDVDFDQSQNLRPVAVDTAFWRRTLNVAFGDFATLVAPARVVLCEGDPQGGVRKDFDAHCLRIIFAETHPDTEFLGVGNDLEVQSDARGIGHAVEALAPGTSVERLIDRDGRSDREVAEIEATGTRVLSRRNLESYLLDDEVLEALCTAEGRSTDWPTLQKAKADALLNSAAPPRNNPPDDLKATSGQIYTDARRVLGMTNAGNNNDAFMRDTLAPIVRPGMAVYEELRTSVFGA